MRRLNSTSFAGIPFPIWLLLLAAALVFPLFVEGYLLRVASLFYMYLALAVGLTLIVNYAGLLNLGFIAFFGIGAYTYAVLNTTFGIPFFLALPLGAALAGLGGFLIGFPTLRVRGDYLALVTLAFGEILRSVFTNIWGPHGIPGIAPALPSTLIGGAGNFVYLNYFVALATLPVAFFVLAPLDRSALARRWFAIRDDEVAAQSCGIAPSRSLLIALVIGTTLAGMAGVVFAAMQRFVSPASFILEESIFILSIVVIAGGRSAWRLIAATALLVFLPEVLRGLADYRMLVFGAILAGYVVIDEKLKLSRSHPKDVLPLTADRDTPALSESAVPQFLNLAPTAASVGLTVEALCKDFGAVRALRKVDLNIEFNRSIIGLIGPNGSGKTTLFNCVSGFLSPTRGKIRFCGRDLPPVSHAVARMGLARTFQTPRVFDSMTVRENVAMGEISRVGEKTEEEINELLAYCGLSDYADAMVADQPLGVQRLVELARALASRPRLVLLDEIASGLSFREKQRLAEIIAKVRSEAGVNFLIVEHDMDFIFRLCEEVIVLDLGEVIARGPGDSVARDPEVIKAYLGGSHAAA